MALTNEFGFTVGGVHSSNFNIKIMDIQRNVFPEVSENLLNIPARQGAYFTGLNIQHRVIQVNINIVALSHGQRLGYVEQIATWLLNATADQEIVFDDQPDRAYYGHVANSSQVTRSLFNGKTTLELHCSDPFAYAVNDTTIGTSGDSGNYIFTFNNNGSAEAYPRFTTTFSKNASFISYVSPKGVILLGQPSDASLPSTPATTTILNDNMLDSATWTNAGSSGIDPNSNYVNTGSIQQMSDGVGVSSFGTPVNGSVGNWHGPAIRKNLPSTVQDFTVKTQISLSSKTSDGGFDPKMLGRIEILLYDANNAKIGKMVLTDGLAAYDFNIPEFHMGANNDDLMVIWPSVPAPQVIQQKDPVYYTVVRGDTLGTIARRYGLSLSDLEAMNGISSSNTTIQPGQRLKIKDSTKTQTIYPTKVGNYNDFFGQLTIQRIGTTWYAEIKRLDNGNSTYLQSKTYYDNSKKYPQTPLAYIVVWMAQMDSWTPCSVIEVNNIQVIQNNAVDTSTHSPTIFQAGDVLEVDCTDSSVRLNNDLIMDKLDIGSTFFPVIAGSTQVRILTDDDGAGHSATFTQRYLS